MAQRKGREEGAGGLAEERVEGDEVAFSERSGQAAGGAAGGHKAPGVRRRTARTTKRVASRLANYTGEQRLLIFDLWRRSELTATDFAPLVGVTRETLYSWRRRFQEHGPAGLVGLRTRQRGSRVSEAVKRAILMMKEQHPDWGQDRIHDMLLRGEGLLASAGAVQRVLLEAGYEVDAARTRPHPPKVKRFERTKPNELWQTDLFTFLLKRQRRRVHLVAFMDDFSRFIVGFGLHASASGAMVRETFEASIANYGAPWEVLTDNGSQYHTWRGKSAFRKLCMRRGIKQTVASPRHPQTLGKVERFWGTLWREMLEGAIFRDLDEARVRVGHFAAWYNFRRTHQGIGGLVPADRYFEAAAEVRAALEKCVAENAIELALHGEPRRSVYVTGRVGGEAITLHGEGTRVILTGAHGTREEVDLEAPGRRVEEAPGTSKLDAVLEDLEKLGERGVEPDEAASADESPDESSDESERS